MLRGIVFGTGTNYLKVFVRLVTGIVTFKALYQTLGDADFGLFQLLWMSVGYMLLLDFGFGISVQRAMARTEGRAAEAAQERQEVLATVFWGYIAMSALVGVALAAAGPHLLASFDFKGQSGPRPDQQLAAAIFAGGIVIGFPFGIYREALRGQNRLHVANVIDLVFIVVQAAGVIWGCYGAPTRGDHRPWSLPALMAVSVASSIAPPMIMAALAWRSPELRPRPSRIRWSRLRELSAFSLFAYGITATNMLVGRCDQLIIGQLIAIDALKLFVPGLKISDIHYNLAAQMQDTLGPVAARLHADGVGDERLRSLRNLLLISQRWAVQVALPLVLPLALDLPTALRVVTGEVAPGHEMLESAALIICSSLVGLIVSSCTKRILVMIGHHRALLAFSAVEAAGGVGSAIVAASLWHSIVGVALGKAVSTACALVLVPGYSCRAVRAPLRDFLGANLRGLAGAAPALIVGALWWIITARLPLPIVDAGHAPIWRFLIGCGLVACAMPFGWWCFGMPEAERARVREALRRLALARGADGAAAGG